MTTSDIMTAVDDILNSDRWRPRWGWHDDHRHRDGKLDYAPALQQVRAEFAGLVDAISAHGLIGGRALQLGLGECGASHAAWGAIFNEVGTVDLGAEPGITQFRGNTHSVQARAWASELEPLDFLFIDAGHTRYDVMADYRDYSPLVRPGGLIAFHDALPRPGYPEVGVWEFMVQLGPVITVIGTEVGTAWMVKL